MALRDEMTDSGRTGGTVTAAMVGHFMSFAPLTIQQEHDLNGYNLGDRPTGKGSLRPLDTSGQRGAGDSSGRGIV